MDLAKWFAAAFIVLTPSSRTVGPAALNMQWSDLAGLGFLVSLIASKRWRVQDLLTPPWWIALYVALILPSFLAAHGIASWVELLKTTYLVCVMLAIWRWATEWPVWMLLMRIAAITAALMTGVTVVVWAYATWSGHVPWQMGVTMDVPNVGYVVRMKGWLLTPTFLANYLTMGLPLLAGYVAACARWPRAVTWAAILACLIAVGTTASHSLGGSLVAAAIIAPRMTRWDRIACRVLWILAVAVFLYSIVSTCVAVHSTSMIRAPAASAPARVADHEFLGPHGTGEELTIRIQYGWVSYLLLKRFAWETWTHHPWIGLGLGQFPGVVAQAFQDGRIHAYYSVGADPHNTWLGSLAETGLFGFLGTVIWWVVIVTSWAKSRATLEPSQRWRVDAPFAGLAGLAINSLHVDIMHFRFVWLGAALLLAASSKQEIAPHEQ